MCSSIHFHIFEVVAIFFSSSKFVLVRYFEETTVTQILSGSIKIYQPSFANKTVLHPEFSYTQPPLHFGRHILSHDIKGLGYGEDHALHYFLKKESTLGFSNSFKIILGIFMC